MKILRHLFLALLFMALTALEIAHGISRLNSVREVRHQEILADVARGQSNLSRETRVNLEGEREHAGYLARLPEVRRLLKARPGSSEEARGLESNLLPYLVSFRDIDRVRVLDNQGTERFRCERIGRGVGALPPSLLDTTPDSAMLALTRDARLGEVVLSDIGIDSRRVEVPESERQVLHFATTVSEGDDRLGILVLTVYAAPLLSAIRGFSPFPGVQSMLVARDGSYLASTNRSLERGSPLASNLRNDHPEVAERILSGAESARTAEASYLALSTGEVAVPWRIVTVVPDSALDAASDDLRGEYAWVIGSMVLTTLVLIFAGAFLVRMSVRELELREQARYEKQQKALERQMQVAERLGSLGLLTAGVAHEINNPLEGIENYLALLEREPVSAEKRKRYIEMVRYGFHRIRDIVRDLSTFARPGVRDTTADIGRVVRHALKMVGYTKDFKGIEVRLSGLDVPVHVPGDSGRLEQVFINLLLNAARAMKGSGEIRIGARSLEGKGGEGARIEVSVEDTGPGIPEENLARIFDPFFTTTDGTGLGLSISYGIIHAHGGTIVAQNLSTGGARFILSLPVSEAAVVARSSDSARMPASSRAGEAAGSAEGGRPDEAHREAGASRPAERSDA